MTKSINFQIPVAPVTCQIEINSGILSSSEIISKLSVFGSKFAIITDDNTAKRFGTQLKELLDNAGLFAYLFTYPSGELSKTRQTKEKIENEMLALNLNRDTCVIALGGGVSTDLGGFIAATYCRGLPLIMIPTTVLGMVDASIGGKNGLDVPHGKNLIGSVYQPKLVIMDPKTLRTLPLDEIKSGMVEMIKHGLIIDADYFEFLEIHAKKLLLLDPEVLERAIFESVRIKLDIVKEDEHESGKRRLLNLGHTVAHAIEKLSDFTIKHGFAVALGIYIECYMSLQLGYMKENTFERIKKIFETFDIPLQWPKDITSDALINAMTMDKKSLKGKPRFILMDAIGSSMSFNGHYCTEVDEGLLRQSVDSFCNSKR